MPIFIGFIFCTLIALMSTIGCGKSVGLLLSPPLEGAIVLASGDGNHRGVAIYNVDGQFLGQITNFRADGKTPRGIAQVTNNSFLIAHDTVDSIDTVNFDGTTSVFHGSAQFSGAIYGIEYIHNRVFAVESNRIEAFFGDGTRDTSMYITTTIGSCTMGAPRLTDVNANGYLVVADQTGGDFIHRYDVSGSSPTCVSSQAFAGDTPYGVVAHSNGNLYVTTWGDDLIYETAADGSGASAIWTADLTVVRDPTAIDELPNGDLIVANSYLDTVERITTTGVRVGATPFIRDQNTLNITDMLVLRGVE